MPSLIPPTSCVGGPTNIWGNKAIHPDGDHSVCYNLSPCTQSCSIIEVWGAGRPESQGLLLEKLLRRRFWGAATVLDIADCLGTRSGLLSSLDSPYPQWHVCCSRWLTWQGDPGLYLGEISSLVMVPFSAIAAILVH